MALLEDMKSLIVSVTPTITLTEMPDSPDTCLALFRTGGFDPEHTFNARAYEQPTFQIRSRSTSAATAEQLLLQCKTILDGKVSFTVGSTGYVSVFQQGDIMPLGKDERGRTEYSLNFQAKVK